MTDSNEVLITSLAVAIDATQWATRKSLAALAMHEEVVDADALLEDIDEDAKPAGEKSGR